MTYTLYFLVACTHPKDVCHSKGSMYTHANCICLLSVTVRIALSEALCYSHGHVRIAPCYLHVIVRIALCYSHMTVRIATAFIDSMDYERYNRPDGPTSKHEIMKFSALVNTIQVILMLVLVLFFNQNIETSICLLSSISEHFFARHFQFQKLVTS